MSRFKSLAVIVCLVVALVVVLQNTETVRTRFLFVTVEMPRVLLLAIMLAVGVILGLALAAKWGGSKKKD